jgi:hypothetical protein
MMNLPVLPFLLLAHAPAVPPVINLSGEGREARSPVSRARLYFVGRRPGPLRLMFDDGTRHPMPVLTIERNVDVGWAPDGRSFFVNDNMGSNFADCVVMRPLRSGLRRMSLAAATGRLAGHPTGAEAPPGAHYYVTCGGWLTATRVSGSIWGHTNDPPHMHDFTYRFVYDTGTGRAKWQPGKGTGR